MITRRDFLVGATAISVTPLIPGVSDAASAQSMTDVTAAELRRRKDLETFLKVFPPSSSTEIRPYQCARQDLGRLAQADRRAPSGLRNDGVHSWPPGPTSPD